MYIIIMYNSNIKRCIVYCLSEHVWGIFAMRTKDFDIFFKLYICFNYIRLFQFFLTDDPLQLNPDPVARTFYRADPVFCFIRVV